LSIDGEGVDSVPAEKIFDNDLVRTGGVESIPNLLLPQIGLTLKDVEINKYPNFPHRILSG